MKGKHLGEFEELVLLSVRQLGADASVLAIKSLLGEAADRKASLGAIYAALDRAERKGLSLSELGDALPERGGRARRFYELTAAGESALVDSRRVREALWLGSEEVVP
jgi:PadR family transcriptional regulator PadR